MKDCLLYLPSIPAEMHLPSHVLVPVCDEIVQERFPAFRHVTVLASRHVKCPFTIQSASWHADWKSGMSSIEIYEYV